MNTHLLRKSNKIYTCCECNDSIKKGELYERVGNFKTCSLCVQIRNKFFSRIIRGELQKNLEKVAYGLTLEEFDGLNMKAVYKIDRYFTIKFSKLKLKRKT